MNASLATIPELISRRRAGFSLEQPFYMRPDIFELEREKIFTRQWLLTGHGSEIPNPGDYYLYDVAGESIIVIRDENGGVNAFFNVCRHRGSRICLTETGRARRLVCRYHAWTYRLDGSLTDLRHIPGDLDPKDFGLHRCAVRVYHDLIFICLDPDAAPDFEQIAADVEPYIAMHRLERCKVACTKEYPTHANWKLVLENFVECYHCRSSHPEFTAVDAYVDAEEMVDEATVKDYQDFKCEWSEIAGRLGYPTGEVRSDGSDPALRYTAYRYPLRRGFKSGTRDGEPAGPLMGDLTEFDGAFTIVAFGFFGTVIAANDYAVLFSFQPISADFTRVRLRWLVNADAEQGRDFDMDRMTWLWDVTTQQDTDIIQRNAAGVSSYRYMPGPYSTLEWATDMFASWYLKQIG